MTDHEMKEMVAGPRVSAADVRSRTEGAFTRSAEIRPFAAFLLGAVTLASVSPLAQAVQKAMYVSVVDQAGAPVPNLGPSDFIVREDDVAREVVNVVPADEPMQVAVLVDTSDVAREQIPYLRDAVPTFVNTLISGGVRNQVAIVAFGERPTILADYTSNSAVLKKATDLIWANPMSGPYLLDAILEVSEGLTKREAPRPVIIAIAAEGQELSYRHDDQVLDRLRKSGAQLYVLMLGTPYGGRNEEARKPRDRHQSRARRFGRTPRAGPDRHRARLAPQDPRRPAQASVPRHLLVPPDAHPARKGHRQSQGRRTDCARGAHQGPPGTSVTAARDNDMEKATGRCAASDQGLFPARSDNRV
jgi:hypothetical protein